MLDRTVAQRPDRSPGAAPDGRERRRALVACAGLALALHAVFFGGVGGLVPGVATETIATPVSVRTLPGEPEVEPPAAVVPAATPPVFAAPAVAMSRPRPPRRAREPSRSASQALMGIDLKASADSDSVVEAPGVVPERVLAPPVTPAAVAAAEPEASAASAASEIAGAPGVSAANAASEVAEAPGASAAGAVAGAPAPLLAAGEQAPPVYRTQLPPSVTLHYEVRRGFLRGTGEIRWQSSGDRYRLALEARIAGLALLMQTSEGGIDANGLAPERFVDQRARRSAQAANFRRDDGRITFSGSGVEWPLLAGSQDRLSWMIQLAGIAAAEPERLVEGGRIAMIVVGARGDAGVWTLRYAGREDIATAWGTVHAVKFVREGRSAYDTSAEIWLDPERSYLPAHATLRNSSGASEYDLLLERVDPPP